MRKYIQKQLIEILQSLHNGIIHVKKNKSDARIVLTDCYSAVNSISNALKMELSNKRFLEYNEALNLLKAMLEFLFEAISNNEVISDIITDIKVQIMFISNELKNESEIKLEVVFMPYKASMWDSLESIWLAAKDDDKCDAYVVPIPYYDRNPDGTFKQLHYEGNSFPSYVPILHYDNYVLEKRLPDVIYIHNPYDELNIVTSVEPKFYSYELKKYTDCLVYVPYFSTSGGMNEGQKSCSAYYHVDYIIVQAQKYKGFYDAKIPQNKILPLGSPKFDRIIKMCENPPEPPALWKAKMAGKKVYFYNTSLNGMLADTHAFLIKMSYIFDQFIKHEDSCIIWRPHPLFESTLKSMRPGYLPIFIELKRKFITNDIGIYDDTDDINKTIALCDAYIGDSGTSVTSLFGITGKPLFLLNNKINTEPKESDYQCLSRIPTIAVPNINPQYSIAKDNKLYYSPNNDFKYEYLYDLSENSFGYNYRKVINVNGNNYICPYNANDIIMLDENNNIIKRIPVKKQIEQPNNFGVTFYDKYIILISLNYPDIIIYDTQKDDVKYVKVQLDLFFDYTINGVKRFGGVCFLNGYYFVANPIEDRILALEIATGSFKLMKTNVDYSCGSFSLNSDGKDIWILPLNGSKITRWNPFSGESQAYDNMPDGLKCKNYLHGYECMEMPFWRLEFEGDNVYISPYNANMFVKLNKQNGQVLEWEIPVSIPQTYKNGYFYSMGRAFLYKDCNNVEKNTYRLYSAYDRKLYNVDLKNNKFTEIKVECDLEVLRNNVSGFDVCSEWMRYACYEDVFNSLGDFLDGNITGKPFNKETQIKEFRKIADNNDGSCGEKIHSFVKERFYEN